MRFSLNHAFLVLALAIGSVEPVDAIIIQNEPPLRHSLFKRAADGFHKTALRHSSGLARDLRLAFRGLGGPSRAAVFRSSNKAYCVSNIGLGTSNGTGSSENHSTATPTSTGKGSPTASASSKQLNWQLAQSYSGSTFFSGWDFFTGGDPTNGIVQYVDQQTAQSGNLIQINDAGNALMRVDTTPQVTGNRNSVRIQTQYAFTGGLLIMDSVHMPTGCGTWPAFWTNGQKWPMTGEIDIVEGVNNYTNNQATVHTGTGCTLPTSNAATLGISGTVVGGTNCAALQTGNQGCGVRATQTNSFGKAFNDAGGGVFAMRWDNSGIAVYFFSRNNIPQDITNGTPMDTTWGSPSAYWPATNCNPFQFFTNHNAIFDTTLCGDWAGGVWTATGIPGQEQSCAQRTGVATCEQFVRQNGASLSEAYWEVKSLHIYQSQGQH